MKRTVTIDNGPSKRFKTSKNAKATRRSLVPQATRSAIQRAISAARETKMVTVNVSEQAISSLTPSFTMYRYPVPNAGSSVHERVGNKISPVGLKLTFLLHNNNGSYEQYVRLLLIAIPDGQIADTNVTGAPFESNGNDATPSGYLHDLIRKTNREEFKVLKDWVVPLGTTTGGQRIFHDKHYIKLGHTPDMVFMDSQPREPQNTRYALLVLNRESDADESVGSSIELSFAMDFYYKD